MTELCGAWRQYGGCVLPRGHNMGQADVPEAHLFPGHDADDWAAAWDRIRRSVARPRVSWCRTTRKYVLTLDGRPHRCSRSWKLDEAFRSLGDAVDAGRVSYTAAVERVRYRFERQFDLHHRWLDHRQNDI